MKQPAHKIEWVNRTKNVRFYPSSCTGKERDEETGYGYFGARYMDHELMTMWLSVDPMADKYPSLSPYNYCAWNPIKLIDPDGREINPVYSKDGDFLGNTKEGFTGHPLIMNKNDYEMMMDVMGANDLSELSAEDVKNNGGTTFDDAESRGVLSGDAQEKIVRNIISQYSDPDLSQNYGFNASDLSSKIKYDADGTIVGNTNFARVSSKSGKKPTMFYFRHNNKKYEFTVENIISSIVYHEWFGHDVMGYGSPNQLAKASEGGTHYACYLSVMSSPLWSRTTPSYQKFNQDTFDKFFK